jgi:cytidylate kinase
MENFIITIARTYGSGGKTMGKMLAKELEISYYDRELLRMASDDSGINESLFGEVDEKLKRKSFFHRFKKKDTDIHVLSPESDAFVSNDNLFNYQAKIIKDIAAKKSCVIIGRCADYLLADQKNCIRIYCHAPLENCVKRLEAKSGLSKKEIVKKIGKIDKYRSSYYKYYTGEEWNDATNYDMCINTASMSYEEIINAVKAYIEIVKKR